MSSITPVQVYEQFYDVVDKWGRYRIVDAPNNAQLIFEIGRRCPAAPWAIRGWSGDPAIVLVIRDEQSRAVLWTITTYIRGSTFKQPFQKSWNKGMHELFSNLEKVAEGAASTAEGGKSSKRGVRE